MLFRQLLFSFVALLWPAGVTCVKQDQQLSLVPQPAPLLPPLIRTLIGTRRQSSSSTYQRNNNNNPYDYNARYTPNYINPYGYGDSDGREMHHLLRKIFSTYDKEVMPSRPVVVHMDVLLLKVKSTIEKEGIFESVIALFVEWTDSRMSWNPDDYENNVTVLAFDSDRVWLPDIAMTNSADHLYSISRDNRFVVRVSNKGNFKFVPTGTARTWCELKLPTFPFDVQTCSLEFESWSLDSSTMTFDGKSHLLQWALCNYQTITYHHLYEFTGETFTRVRFDFTVKRKSMFYVLILIFPSTLLSMIQLLVFIIPSDDTTADRIGFGTTNLLTLVVFQTIVTEEMPKTSDAVTSLSKYIIALIIIAAMGIFESVLVERMLRVVSVPPPRLLVRVIDEFMPMLCGKKKSSRSSNDSAHKVKLTTKFVKPSIVSNEYQDGDSGRFTASCFQFPKKGRFLSKGNRVNAVIHANQNCSEQDIIDAITQGGERPYERANSPFTADKRRNSYFAALSRGDSTSFIVKLMKNGETSTHLTRQASPMNIDYDDEDDTLKDDFDLTKLRGFVPPRRRGTIHSTRSSIFNFTRSTLFNKTASNNLDNVSEEPGIPGARGIGSIVGEMDPRQRRNLKLWALLARYLDCLAFAICSIMAIFIPVMLFIPLVYFDDRCAGESWSASTMGPNTTS